MEFGTFYKYTNARGEPKRPKKNVLIYLVSDQNSEMQFI